MVEVYTKPSCQPCEATKRYLTRYGVAFTERAAADHLDALRALGFAEAPVVVAGDRSWSGSRPDALRGLLDAA